MVPLLGRTFSELFDKEWRGHPASWDIIQLARKASEALRAAEDAKLAGGSFRDNLQHE